MSFFLEGVIQVSRQGVETARAAMKLFEEDQKTIKERAAPTAFIIYDRLKKDIVVNSKNLTRSSSKSQASVLRALKELEKLGVVKEITQGKRNKVFVYKKYLDLLAKEV